MGEIKKNYFNFHIAQASNQLDSVIKKYHIQHKNKKTSMQPMRQIISRDEKHGHQPTFISIESRSYKTTNEYELLTLLVYHTVKPPQVLLVLNLCSTSSNPIAIHESPFSDLRIPRLCSDEQGWEVMMKV